MATRRVAFLAAGALWLGLGILLILTVFGTLVGVLMAYLVGLRRNVLAARVGAVMGVLLFIPCQLVLEAMGCRSNGCSLEPYLFAFGVPAGVTGLNLLAGWPVRATGQTVAASSAAWPLAGSTPSTAPVPAGAGDEAPGQQLLWDVLPGSTPPAGRELQGEPANAASPAERQPDADAASVVQVGPVEPASSTLWPTRRRGRILDGDPRPAVR